MSCLGNLIWFIVSGLWTWIGWTFVGVIWCLTIVGIPVGVQCFKIARLSCLPFGKRVEYRGNNTSLLLNILWIVFGGLELAIGHLTLGVFLALTIVGIPFAKQNFKLAQLALMPFGTEIY
ncbi:YccF domain-containing protein [Lagierella sp.]|uniref:YccF domain-containing protein n=1 Tax=Lagierella sp. TaxID=2849657 RepID=UPI00261824D4|nr:YccF domain-containing protein [Lagierella sp.]